MKLVLLAEAEEELTDAAAWYDDRRAGRIPFVRRFVLPRFPYAVAYQVYADRCVASRLMSI